jgi:hypothetical protein
MRKESPLRAWPLAALFAAAALVSSCSSSGLNQGAANSSSSSSAPSPGGVVSRLTEKTFTLPAGTALTVTVNQTLASNQSRVGDAFDASVAEDVVVDGKTVISRGAKVIGRVTGASPSGRLQNPGSLAGTLTSVEVNGKSYDLATDSFARKASSHKTRNAEYIGGGAAAGAIIGAIAGHGKGAAIGAAAGAGAGTAGAAVTGKKDVSIPAETRLTFHLKEPLSVSVKG